MSSEEWVTKPLGELITLQRGYDLPKSKVVYGEYPIAGSNGIIGYHNQFTTEGPSITIGRSGNLGTPYFYEGNFWAHNTTLFVKEFKNSDPKFIYYLLKTLDFSTLNSGSAVPSLNRNYLHPVNVIVPKNFEMQRRIAEILSALDEKIELNRQTNATLEAIAQAIFKEWFVDFNYPGATGEMVDSPLGPIPKDWRVGSLSDICLVTKGISYKSSELQSSKTALVTLKSINRGGGFNNDGFKEYIGKYKPVQTLNEGDLVLAQTDLTQKAEVIGSPAIVENPFEYETLVASLDIAKCEPRNEMPSSNSLHHFLQRQEFKDYCLSQTNGSTVLHLRTSEIPNYELIIPDAITLQKFDLMVTPIRESVLTNNKQNQTLEAVRDKLLPKLINGEIEV